MRLMKLHLCNTRQFFTLISPFVLIIALFISGCHHPPTFVLDSQAHRVVEKHLQVILNNGGKTIDFKKLSGDYQEKDGEKIYLYEYLITARIPAGIAWADYGLDHGEFVKYAGQKGNPWIVIYDPLPEGSIAISRGSLKFLISDLTWEIPNSPFSSVDGYCKDPDPAPCIKYFMQRFK